jgi:hypothetical protein
MSFRLKYYSIIFSKYKHLAINLLKKNLPKYKTNRILINFKKLLILSELADYAL